MTIDTILTDLQNKHGNDWPNAAITQLLILSARLALMTEDEPNYPGQLAQYKSLRAWIHDTLCAGIATRQTSASSVFVRAPSAEPPAMPDLSLLYTRPTTRRSNRPDMVDLFIPAPGGGSYSIANYVRGDIADAILIAINERDQLIDLLANLVDDAPNARPAAISFLNRRLSELSPAPAK